MTLQVGDTIPEFKLYNYDKQAYEDKDFLGKKTMFVFLLHLAVFAIKRFAI